MTALAQVDTPDVAPEIPHLAPEVVSTAAEMRSALETAIADREALAVLFAAVSGPEHNAAVSAWCGHSGTPEAGARFARYLSAMKRALKREP